MTKYRIQVICDNVILARTLEGDNHSDVFDKAVKYSFEEAMEKSDFIARKSLAILGIPTLDDIKRILE